MKAADVRAMTLDQLDDEVAQAQEGAVQSALPARHRPAREHLARARHPPRHRAHEDHRRAEARGAPEPAASAAPKRKPSPRPPSRRPRKRNRKSRKPRSRSPRRAARPAPRRPPRSRRSKGLADAEAHAAGRRGQRQAGQDGGRARRAAFHPSDDEEDHAPVEEVPRARREERVRVGDMVWIEERRPISKLKCWEVIRGEKKAESAISVHERAEQTKRAAS